MKYLKVGDRVRNKYTGCKGHVVDIKYYYNYDCFDVQWDNGALVGYMAEGGWIAVELIDDGPLPLPG